MQIELLILIKNSNDRLSFLVRQPFIFYSAWQQPALNQSALLLRFK